MIKINILKSISVVLFWPPMIFIGIEYGWELPVALFLILLGLLFQHHANKADQVQEK